MNRRTDRDVISVPQRTLRATKGTACDTRMTRGQSRDLARLVTRFLDAVTPVEDVREVAALFGGTLH